VPADVTKRGSPASSKLPSTEGVMVTMGPSDPEHASPIQILTEVLLPPLIGRAAVRTRMSIVAANESEPEPDVAIVPLGNYRHAHPTRPHCIIEVAHSSVSKDRNIKAPLYAASGFGAGQRARAGHRGVSRFGRDTIPKPRSRGARRSGDARSFSGRDHSGRQAVLNWGRAFIGDGVVIPDFSSHLRGNSRRTGCVEGVTDLGWSVWQGEVG